MKGEILMKKLLEDEIKVRTDELQHLSIGTDEYQNAVQSLSKLMDEYLKFNEAEATEEKTSEDKKWKILNEVTNVVEKTAKIAISIAGIAVPALVAVWGTKMSLSFEETGCVTSIAGREFIKGLFHK